MTRVHQFSVYILHILKSLRSREGPPHCMCALSLGKVMDFLDSCIDILGPFFLFFSFSFFFFFFLKQVKHMLESVAVLGYILQRRIGRIWKGFLMKALGKVSAYFLEQIVNELARKWLEKRHLFLCVVM